MATRRFQRAPTKRRFVRRARQPLRTHSTKETRWNTSRFVTSRTFAFDFESIQNVDIVVINPKILFELTLQPTTPVGGPVQNIAPIINTLQAMRGVKVGGIVWDSGFHTQIAVRDDDEDIYVNAYARCYETLWTRRVDEQGFPTEVPDINSTWRPLRVDDSVFDPTENDGDLVRIHHTRYALVAAGDNAFGWNAESTTLTSLGAASPTSSTWTQPGWGGTRSLRLRKFIADDQQLSFNLVVTNPNASATIQPTLTWTCAATVYWAMQNQR